MTVMTAPARYSPMTSVPTSASTASASTPRRRCRAASITHEQAGTIPTTVSTTQTARAASGAPAKYNTPPAASSTSATTSKVTSTRARRRTASDLIRAPRDPLPSRVHWTRRAQHRQRVEGPGSPGQQAARLPRWQPRSSVRCSKASRQRSAYSSILHAPTVGASKCWARIQEQVARRCAGASATCPASCASTNA